MVIGVEDIKKKETKKVNSKGVVLRLKDLHKIKRWEGFEINKHWEKIENIGLFMKNMNIRQGPFEGVKNAWKNQTCYVIGGSIAGRGLDLTLLDGKHTICVNHMIEYYDKCEWFIFQDQRFLKKTKYNLADYEGKIFAHNSAPIFYEDVNDLVLFKSLRRTPVSLEIEKGLYQRALTGLCAVHLALISGANKIYLIGMDTPKSITEDVIEETGLHYEKDYTGETRLQQCYENVINKLQLFREFYPWKDRIINVCENGYMDWFKEITLNELNVELTREKEYV
jgi:hypothetical protein